MKAIIIHGAYGNSEENWIPWLKSELEKKGYEVFAPNFPTPEGQSLKNWLKVFEEYEKFLGPDTVLVGHSLAPAFILSVLEKSQNSVLACFFVSGFTGKLNNPKFDKINQSFTEKTFDWKKIKSRCRNFVVFASDNDPYVPGEKTGELADRLDAEFVYIKGAGHFNSKAGYAKFPLLLEKILTFSPIF
jgi:uncharacterized protein